MAEPYLGEMRMVGFDWAPRGWARCDGQLLAINQYQSLYSLLGTTYGGDGRTTFGLPDMRGRAPVHASANPAFRLGARSGYEQVTGRFPGMTLSTRARPVPYSTTARLTLVSLPRQIWKVVLVLQAAPSGRKRIAGRPLLLCSRSESASAPRVRSICSSVERFRLRSRSTKMMSPPCQPCGSPEQLLLSRLGHRLTARLRVTASLRA